jgi:hypothetical protein
MPSRALAVCCSTFVLWAAFACAQTRGVSEHGLVAQTIDGTTITIEYYRPVARGRDSLFGRVVRWEQMWTPGANWATTMEVDKGVHVDGHAVPKGKYSVWMVPRPEEWTVILSRDSRRFHTQPPDSADEQARFLVRPERGLQTETLTWSFPAVVPDGATLRMQWGTTSIPLRIAVEPSGAGLPLAEEPGVYVGTYRLRSEASGASGGGQIEVSASKGGLHARWTPPGYTLQPEFDLIADGPGRFHPVYHHDSRVIDVEAETVIAFRVEGGHATGVEVRGIEGRVVARGERVGKE